MPAIKPGRFTAVHNQSLVIFIIGMRINRFWQFNRWLPVARSMRPMITELAQDPDSGFMGAEMALSGLRTIMLVQYWRDFEALENYARARDRKHLPAWAEFNQKIGDDGSVGIFHETYCVPEHQFETVYDNMPPFGLGRISGLASATGSRSGARSRMKGEAPDLI